MTPAIDTRGAAHVLLVEQRMPNSPLQDLDAKVSRNNATNDEVVVVRSAPIGQYHCRNQINEVGNNLANPNPEKQKVSNPHVAMVTKKTVKKTMSKQTAKSTRTEMSK